ncbi:hypothetical protein E3J49_00725 [Candidatus Bathyarchaeota archaeon]|nr:MAG: hypothetical protein E3J49_00725 [Candidatus Bathyarchaeota archaeon]
MDMEEIARWSYIIFVILAVIMGLAVGYMAYEAELGWEDPGVEDTSAWVILIMLILGIIIGITSITAKEVTPFLIATIALLVASAVDVWGPLDIIHPLLADWATGIMKYIVAFAAPAAVIIAIKAVLGMAKD